MKISLNWLRQYVDIYISAEKLAEVLTSLGLEVAGVEELASIKGGMKGIVAGYVEECYKHPNADKLHLAKVDIGAGPLLQIVCGAPNVAVGQKVWVATEGTTIYPAGGEPRIIKKSKIRDEYSEGMICAEDEMGIGTDHSGILVLPEDLEIGTLASDYYEVEYDFVFDIDLTPNRSDATSHLGVAKDLYAYFTINRNEEYRLKLPSLQHFHYEYKDYTVDVSVENPQACPRYSGITLKNVKIKESPRWLKNRLNSISVRPINNVVDITNFILHELGQPLHAFDADKIAGSKIIVKCLEEGSTFVTLDEQERKLSSDDLMICDGEGHGLCIAGVFGGIGSGVNEGTTNIFLESAYFDAKSVRRTSMRHLLRTDAAIIFEKGADPSMTVYALKRAAVMMQELTGGQIASEIVDVYPVEVKPVEIDLAYNKVNKLVGMELTKSHVHDILMALDFKFLSRTEETMKLQAPSNKADVTRPADVIEEILRIHGLNNVEIDNSIRTTIQFTAKLNSVMLKQVIKDFLNNRGFHEMMNLSLISSKTYKSLMPELDDQLIYINNTSNVHLDIMRPEMLCPSLESVAYNQNRQHDTVVCFEIGNIYRRIKDEIVEKEKLIIVMKGRTEEESWLEDEKTELSFFDLKRELKALFSRLGISGMTLEESETTPRFSYAGRYLKNDFIIAEFGEVSSSFLDFFDIKGPVYFASIDFEILIKVVEESDTVLEEISKFPGIRRDLAIVIDENIQFEQIEKLAMIEGKDLLKIINLFDVYRNKNLLGEDKKSYAISLNFEDPTKTLQDKDVDKIMRRLISSIENKLNAQIRK